MMLLRPWVNGPAQEQFNETFTATVRDRLLLARAGDWFTLAHDLLDDVNAMKPSSSHAEPVQGEVSQACAQAATLKARGGSLRGAAMLLVGEPAVPPSAETTAQIRELFHTGDRPPQQEHELQQALHQHVQ